MKRLPAWRHWLVITLSCLSSTTLASTSYGQTGARVTAQDALRRAAAAPVAVIVSPHTGLALLVSATSSAPVAISARPTDPAEDRAAEFIDSFGAAFGVRDRFDTRLVKVSGRDSLGMEHVRYQQLHSGVPVTGGELAIHLTGSGVVAVNAKTLAIAEPINGSSPESVRGPVVTGDGEVLGRMVLMRQVEGLGDLEGRWPVDSFEEGD